MSQWWTDLVCNRDTRTKVFLVWCASLQLMINFLNGCFWVCFTVFTASPFPASPSIGCEAVTACRRGGRLKAELIKPSGIYWHTSPSLCTARKSPLAEGENGSFCCRHPDSCVDVRFICVTYTPDISHTKNKLSPRLSVSTRESAVGRRPVTRAWGEWAGQLLIDSRELCCSNAKHDNGSL